MGLFRFAVTTLLLISGNIIIQVTASSSTTTPAVTNQAPAGGQTTSPAAQQPTAPPANTASTSKGGPAATTPSTTTTQKTTSTTQDPWVADNLGGQIDAVLNNCSQTAICNTEYSLIKAASTKTDRCKALTSLKTCISANCTQYPYTSTMNALDAYCGCGMLQATVLVTLLMAMVPALFSRNG